MRHTKTSRFARLLLIGSLTACLIAATPRGVAGDEVCGLADSLGHFADDFLADLAADPFADPASDALRSVRVTLLFRLRSCCCL